MTDNIKDTVTGPTAEVPIQVPIDVPSRKYSNAEIALILSELMGAVDHSSLDKIYEVDLIERVRAIQSYLLGATGLR